MYAAPRRAVIIIINIITATTTATQGNHHEYAYSTGFHGDGIYFYLCLYVAYSRKTSLSNSLPVK